MITFGAVETKPKPDRTKTFLSRVVAVTPLLLAAGAVYLYLRKR